MRTLTTEEQDLISEEGAGTHLHSMVCMHITMPTWITHIPMGLHAAVKQKLIREWYPEYKLQEVRPPQVQVCSHGIFCSGAFEAVRQSPYEIA